MMVREKEGYESQFLVVSILLFFFFKADNVEDALRRKKRRRDSSTGKLLSNFEANIKMFEKKEKI